MIQISVNVNIDNDGVVESYVYIGPTYHSVVAGQRQDENIPLDIHRQASKLYDRTLDFAEQIKK